CSDQPAGRGFGNSHGLLARDQSACDFFRERKQRLHQAPPLPDWHSTRNTPTSTAENCLAKLAPNFSASSCRSVSIIKQALIFLSPPRNFSSIDTGWPAGSTAVQISHAAIAASFIRESDKRVRVAMSKASLNRAVTA